MNHLKLFEAKSQKSEFERLIKEILVDLTDQGFYYILKNEETETSYNIIIAHKGKKKPIIQRYDWDADETIDCTFKWHEAKETLEIMVEYLSDIYPKIRFTEFKAERAGRRKKGLQPCYYSLADFSNSLNDDDRLNEIVIKFLLRFRGKIKLY